MYIEVLFLVRASKKKQIYIKFTKNKEEKKNGTSRLISSYQGSSECIEKLCAI